MARQTLGGDAADRDRRPLHPPGTPLLDAVRWASADPAPRARRELAATAADALLATEAAKHTPQALHQTHYAAAGDTGGDFSYPNTDAQYAVAGGRPDDDDDDDPRVIPHDQLPNGWRASRDPVSGRDYYCDPAGVTTWSRPAPKPQTANQPSAISLLGAYSDSDSDQDDHS